MTTADDEFLKALRSTFKIEAAEHLQAIDSGLRELEKLITPSEQLPVIETMITLSRKRSSVEATIWPLR